MKNVFVGNDRTAMRKFREAALSFRLERQLSKDEILTRYLNDLYLGNGVYGVQAASRYYFGTDAEQLTLSQAAMLAGIAPAPSLWNPVRDLDQARARQLYTLNRMLAAGFISPQEASAAYREPRPSCRPRPPTSSPRSRRSSATWSGPGWSASWPGAAPRPRPRTCMFRGGLRVTTTLDLDLQTAVVQALGEVLPGPDDPEAAVVALDPRTGDVRALTTRFDAVVAGTRQVGYTEGGFNLATQAQRSSGSTIKPFTLAAALEAGRSVSDREYAPPCASIPNPGGDPRSLPALQRREERGAAPTRWPRRWSSRSTPSTPRWPSRWGWAR